MISKIAQNIQIQYTNRLRSISINITPQQQVIVKAPKNTREKEILDLIQKKTLWIERKLEHIKRLNITDRPKEYLAGETHYFLGQEYKLVVLKESVQSVSIINNEIIVGNPKYDVNKASQISTKTILGLWYKEQAYSYIVTEALKIFEEFNKVYKLKTPQITFKKMNKRWGMCSNKGIVTFNPELIKTNPKCIEYVIVHELCHLIEHNHSKRFYVLVEKHMPDWKRWKKLLDNSMGKL